MIFYSRFLLVFFTLMFCKHVISVPISTKAKYAVVMDYDTGNILFNKSAEQRIFPASMSKLMTIYILFEALEEGTISLDSEFYVSKKAWRKGGSKMFVEPDFADNCPTDPFQSSDADTMMAFLKGSTSPGIAKPNAFVG